MLAAAQSADIKLRRTNRQAPSSLAFPDASPTLKSVSALLLPTSAGHVSRPREMACPKLNLCPATPCRAPPAPAPAAASAPYRRTLLDCLGHGLQEGQQVKQGLPHSLLVISRSPVHPPSPQVPNVKLRPAQPAASNKPTRPSSRDLSFGHDSGFDSEHDATQSFIDVCPRPFKGVVLCATGLNDKVRLLCFISFLRHMLMTHRQPFSNKP